MYEQPPSGNPQYVVLANYEATDESMLSVNEGEVVEVLDQSKNDWCLVCPSSRTDVEGWVPLPYLTPYVEGRGAAESNRSPRGSMPRTYSLSISSDESTEMSVRSSVSPAVLTPETLTLCDTEEQRSLAEERRR